MKKRLPLIIYIALLAGAFAFASFYGGALPYALLFFLLLYPVFALLHRVYTDLALRVFHELSKRRVEKYEEAEYRLVLENRGPFPIHGLKLSYEEDFCLLPKKEDCISLMPGQRLSFMLPLSCKYAGTYPIGLTSYSISDPFSLFVFRFRTPAEFRAIVRPRVTDVAEKELIAERERSKSGAKHPFLHESIAGTDLRAYQNGDSVRAIHWKNYARTGELMVRKPDEQELSGVHVFLDSLDPEDGDFDVPQRDLFLEYAVSLAHCFLKQGRSIDFCYPAGDLKRMMIASWKDFLSFTDQMPEELSHRRRPETAMKMKEMAGELSQRGEECLFLHESDFHKEVT
ncbi:MAG: DUF58 domain-containing protein [Lachnospiraceae bacterium]|nr:DUF58 domain-containing protein [Lachnospiraceae bacterium]